VAKTAAVTGEDAQVILLRSQAYRYEQMRDAVMAAGQAEETSPQRRTRGRRGRLVGSSSAVRCDSPILYSYSQAQSAERAPPGLKLRPLVEVAWHASSIGAGPHHDRLPHVSIICPRCRPPLKQTHISVAYENPMVTALALRPTIERGAARGSTLPWIRRSPITSSACPPYRAELSGTDSPLLGSSYYTILL